MAAGSGEYKARAGPTATENDPKVIGIAVGPLMDAENLYCSDAAGQAIQVLTFGQGKLKVDGNADNIAVGDALCTHDTDGVAALMSLDVGSSFNQTNLQAHIQELASGFAMALYASTVDGDIIVVKVHGAQGTIT